MAIVYLAQDLKHRRQVAIKVFRPELAAVLGRDRFLREVTTTANLRHPHILPLFDSGEAGEFLFYVMPLVDGESLRDRLAREKQLPLEDVLRVAGEVADALDYAHAHGLVHRDIKPANILLENGHAVVADFGIARAVTAAGAEALTETGLSLGTPLYMSPEQGAGEHMDGRSDQYALACVLYEMLAGEPPFTGRTAQAILARRLMEPVPPLRAVRDSVPVHVEQAINRALSKSPADRFATARQFATALETPGVTVTRAYTPSRHWSRGWSAVAAGLLAVLLGVAVVQFRRSPSARLDPNVMAVFPFRFTGTDTNAEALREGMVDFLEVKFSGAGGARVVPARTALAAWRRTAGPGGEDPTQEEARRVARGLGAGSVVLGTIVATPDRLILNGSLLDTEAGRVRAEAKVEGPPDSLHALVDRFAAQLVALGAGERADHLASLTSTSLPALYAYLAGKVDHRAGHFESATRHFGRALELDSTFVRAALAYHAAADWGGGRIPLAEAAASAAQRFAWSHRDQLSPRERMLLEAYAGRRYPASTPDPEWLHTWLEVAQKIPDDPDVWSKLGDIYFHAGARIGVERPLRHAAEAFNRALALDTTLNMEPMIHLLQIAGMQHDTATVRRLVNRLAQNDPSTAVQRLQAGVVLGDSSMITAARRHVDGTSLVLQQDALLFGFGMQEAERNATLYLARARAGADQLNPAFFLFHFYQQLGRPAAAATAVARLTPKETPVSATGFMFIPALYGYYDSRAAAKIVARLAPLADGPLAQDPAARGDQYGSICGVTWWRLAHGDTRTARKAIRRLGRGPVWDCSLLLEALLAAAEHRPDADAAYNRLDTLLLEGGGRPGWIIEVARWREAQGDLAGALRAARRCAGYDLILQLAYCRREEGRLAALVGDRAGAIDAYSQYLAMRYNPEPSVKPEVDRVRLELAQLVGETN
jgi:eukaryotic-like serine/threonine-protein kinase